MKKTIAILVVLVIALGCVFAGTEKETHSIKLKTTIGGVIPVFQLTNSSLTAKNSIDGDVANVAQTTNGSQTPASFANNGDHTFTTESRDAVFVGDLSRNNVTAVFTAKIANPAKQVKSYTLTFEAGAFEVSRNGVTEGQTLPASTVDTETYVTAKTLVATDGVTMGSTSQYSTVATFNGTTCAASGTELATFTVLYKADSTIDPGDYYATVKLEVTTNS